ncbi:hypothetical protein AGMMS50256_27230 [Betaproteobacteria bacterium]|nr:hypothetical protein AGMMS50256_27230 [Betaproteobacteria bacterium]
MNIPRLESLNFTSKFTDSPLIKAAETKTFHKDAPYYEQSLAKITKLYDVRIPQNNGYWEGEPGNSIWNPDQEQVPTVYNPDGKTWGEILDKFDVSDGIPFKDGYPIFDEVSKGDVQIDDFTTDRAKNFSQADIKLAEQKDCDPEDVEKWRKENGYTWHECEDMKTLKKVPSEIHNNVPHSGGVSEAKKAAQENNIA